MAKPYKLTPMELAFHLSNTLRTISVNLLMMKILPMITLLLLQGALCRVDKHKPYHVRPANVSVTDKKERSVQDSGTTTKQIE